jgi:hypothetical protein
MLTSKIFVSLLKELKKKAPQDRSNYNLLISEFAYYHISLLTHYFVFLPSKLKLQENNEYHIQN